jgi:hypothetical protein
MMEVASISETSVDVYQTTRCNIPEDSLLTQFISKWSKVAPDVKYYDSFNEGSFGADEL